MTRFECIPSSDADTSREISDLFPCRLTVRVSYSTVTADTSGALDRQIAMPSIRVLRYGRQYSEPLQRVSFRKKETATSTRTTTVQRAYYLNTRGTL